MTLDIQQINESTQMCEKTWCVKFDADGGSDAQPPHYGYTVSEDRHKFTGHVWLPNNPPRVRDRNDSTEGVCFVNHKVKRGGPNNRGNTFFHFKGMSYSKYS